jgi:hypothetical protein
MFSDCAYSKPVFSKHLRVRASKRRWLLGEKQTSSHHNQTLRSYKELSRLWTDAIPNVDDEINRLVRSWPSVSKVSCKRLDQDICAAQEYVHHALEFKTIVSRLPEQGHIEHSDALGSENKGASTAAFRTMDEMTIFEQPLGLKDRFNMSGRERRQLDKLTRSNTYFNKNHACRPRRRLRELREELEFNFSFCIDGEEENEDNDSGNDDDDDNTDSSHASDDESFKASDRRVTFSENTYEEAVPKWYQAAMERLQDEYRQRCRRSCKGK